MGYKHAREDLLDAAVDTTLAGGIAALTFAAVGRRLGVSDRTVVYYFPTKDALVMAVLEALGVRLRELLQRAFGDEPEPVRELVQRAWPVLASPAADPVFAVYFEVVGLAMSRTPPYDVVAPRLVDGWVEWLVPHIDAAPQQRRQEALSAVATLDGLLLLRQLSGARAANTAARGLGVLP